MAIELEATPGADDANAYATVEEADEKAAYTVGPEAAAWLASDDEDAKIRALVSMAADIDAIPSPRVQFIGEKGSEDQSMEFPRDSDTTLPARLVSANILGAFIYFSSETAAPLNPTFNDKKKVQSGEESVEWFEPDEVETEFFLRLPWVVQQLLGPLLVWVTTENLWGAGVSVRAS